MKYTNKKETRGHMDLPPSLQALYELQRDSLDHSSSPYSASANRAELGAEFGLCELVWYGANEAGFGCDSGWFGVARHNLKEIKPTDE